jgi:hypothetical protein
MHIKVKGIFVKSKLFIANPGQIDKTYRRRESMYKTNAITG